MQFTSLPYDNILVWSKLKALADDKLKMAEMVEFLVDRVQNIVGKGENAGYQHFLLFPRYFQTDAFPGPCKLGIVCYSLFKRIKIHSICSYCYIDIIYILYRAKIQGRIYTKKGSLSIQFKYRKFC